MNKSRQPEEQTIEQLFLQGVMLFKDKDYQRSHDVFSTLLSEMHTKLSQTSGSSSGPPSSLRKILSELYLNYSLCLLSLQEDDEHQKEIIRSLEYALEYDNLNYWAYFNLFSLYYQAFNYQLALDNIKCCLSCLYLIKAVLSKDFESKTREKDLGKAIGLCPNNLEAGFIRLIMHINQQKWRNANNQLAILEELLAESSLFQQLQALLTPFASSKLSSSSPQPDPKQVSSSAIRLIMAIQTEVQQLRMVASHQEQEEEGQNLVKVINDRVCEFNELLSQINELGHAFGVFHFKSICEQDYSYKKIIVVSNQMAKHGIFRDSQSLSSKEGPTKTDRKGSNHDSESKGLPSVVGSEYKNTDSLFDYTKSRNDDLNESPNRQSNTSKEAQISGNLLSSVQGTPQPISDPTAQSVESRVLANMRKKEVNIQSIQSEIHPLDDNEGFLYHTFNNLKTNHHYSNDDEDLLLQSAYDKSFTNKSAGVTKKQNQKLAASLKNKIQQKKVRIYPLGDKHKFLQLCLEQFQFKDVSQGKIKDLYCQIVLAGGGKNQKFRSKNKNSGQVNFKQKVQFSESLGYLQIPEEPENLQVAVMKHQNDKFYDPCLGKGQIEMTSSGANKIPIYNGAKMVGMVLLRLIFSQEPLKSSFRQSSLSSSNRTESKTSLV